MKIKKDERRTKLVTFRTKESIYKKIIAASKKEKMSVSEYIRKIVEGFYE